MGKFRWMKQACAVLVLCAATAITLRAQTFTSLFSFDGTNGQFPGGALVQATDGNFYGTNGLGGANNSCVNNGTTYGCGTVFKITPEGSLTTLYNFCSQSNCADGAGPAGLIQASDGNFYGTTQGGGLTSCSGYSVAGCGTLFKITPTGSFTTLYQFCSQTDCTDGSNPLAELVQGTDGSLYGTTIENGGGLCIVGTAFKITLSGDLTVLSTFSNGYCVGEIPGTLVQGTGGDFYGTTAGNASQFGHGTVFSITPSGKLTTLYNFCSQAHCSDGVTPNGLVWATNGNFYGTTTIGGTGMGLYHGGTVFEITPSGTLTTLYNFCLQNSCPDGDEPRAGLVQATDGNLYGTTSYGGTDDGGTVFKITPGGTLTTLLDFDTTNGAFPVGDLLQATNGEFYGTTGQGGPGSCLSSSGTVGCGTIFSLSEGLGPFVKTQSTLGKVGSPVTILGYDLKGATSVTFNGTPAKFTVNPTGTAISATVPKGATTGIVKVVTPGGTLSSNLPFRVIQ